MSLPDRPKSIIHGIQVLYFTLVVSIVFGAINIVRTGIDAKYLDVSQHPASLGYIPMIIIFAVSLVILWGLIFLINRGKNWARIIYLILFVLSLLSWAVNFELTLAQGIFAVLSAASNTVLGAIGLCFIFSPSAGKWFKACKKS